MDPIIELKNVTYTYPATIKPSINNLNLSIEAGKFYAIIGSNGSGKTTICNMIRGFIPHFYQGILKGEILFEGKNITEYSLGSLANRIGYVFQNPFNQISGAKDNVYEEIAYGLENFGVSVKEIHQRVKNVIKLTEIEHLQDKNPFELSGGQQQRVALASIIVLEPDILVIDEPTSQLDPQGSYKVFEIINRMKVMGKTIILVEHKMEWIAEYADEVIVLYKGEVLKQGTTNDILSDYSLLEYGVNISQYGILGYDLKQHNYHIPSIPVTEQQTLHTLKNLQRG